MPLPAPYSIGRNKAIIARKSTIGAYHRKMLQRALKKKDLPQPTGDPDQVDCLNKEPDEMQGEAATAAPMTKTTVRKPPFKFLDKNEGRRETTAKYGE